MKNNRSSFKNIRRNNKCDSEKPRNYFYDLFTTRLSDQNETPRELDSIPSFIELLQDNEDNINQEPPTIEEIKNVLKSMKNGN